MIFKSQANVAKIQVALFFASIFLICVLVLAIPRISVPISLAYILTLALGPIVNWLMRFSLSRPQATGLLFLLLTLSVGVPLIRFLPFLTLQARDLQYSLPQIEQYVIDQYEIVRVFIKARTGHELADAYVFQALNQIETFSSDLVIKLPNILATLVEWLFLIPFFTFFFLKDSVELKKTFLNFTPNIIFERFYYVTHMFHKQLGDYFFAKFVEAFIVGFIITVGLLFLDVDYAVILGFVSGLTNIVPYVGPFLGVVPAIIATIIQYGISSPTMGAVLLLYAVANAVDIFFVFPFLVSKIVDIHPILVAIGVILGSHYGGITGMVISIPVVAAIKLIITEIHNEFYTGRSR